MAFLKLNGMLLAERERDIGMILCAAHWYLFPNIKLIVTWGPQDVVCMVRDAWSPHNESRTQQDISGGCTCMWWRPHVSCKLPEQTRSTQAQVTTTATAMSTVARATCILLMWVGATRQQDSQLQRPATWPWGMVYRPVGRFLGSPFIQIRLVTPPEPASWTVYSWTGKLSALLTSTRNAGNPAKHTKLNTTGVLFKSQYAKRNIHNINVDIPRYHIMPI